MKDKEYALIVAGGKGTRVNSSVPKQFVELSGKPILLHTLDAFLRYSKHISITLVLREEDVERWNVICQHHHFHPPITIIPGGETRFQSVRNGLNAIDAEEGLVAIHDGVRPLVNEDIIAASFRLAKVHHTAVAAVRLKESIRITDQDSTKALDRSRFRIIQTPQTFQLSLIKKAYQIKEDPSLTDDASVAEKSGHTISLFEGSHENVKITTAEDLIVVEALLKARQ